MNSIFFDYLGYPIIEFFINDSNKPVDFFILCQHGFKSSSFIKFFPFFLPSYDDRLTQELFVKYLDIEHDFGTIELCHFIFNTLSSETNLAVLIVNCDRGILDANRQDDRCIRPLIKTYVSNTVLSELRKINFFIREKISFLLGQHLDSNGYILDVHSMWPYTLNVNPDNYLNFNDFVQLYESPKYLLEKRQINFIVNNIEGVPISNKMLASSIEKSLRREGYSTIIDRPYYMLPERSNYHYFSHFNGVAIDIPRDLLGDARKNSFPDFSFMHSSQKKLVNLET